MQLFKDYYILNPYHSREEFFWTKQEENKTAEDHWRKLVSQEKNSEFKDIKKRPTNIEIHHQHNRQETTRETYPQKNTKPENHHGSGNPRQL